MSPHTDPDVALRYLASPTCGWPGTAEWPDIIEWVRHGASEQQVRDTLATCIGMAKSALPHEPGIPGA